MDTLDRVRETEFLGRDFLVWLWFKSETGDRIFDLGAAGTAEIWFDGKMTLKTEDDEAVGSITCSGVNPHLREARFALTKGKKVTQAAVRLALGDDEYSLSLDSTWMNFSAFKTPKVVQDNDDDPEGLFYEKTGLIEKAISAIDIVFSSFIKLRISEDWKSRELPALKEWIDKGK